eukprot:NODE_23_length_42016_cov_0.755803.p34 type:complete len:125 gc:universal NODE_23_length_42016_cov_0.755803:2821-2447(-)
MPVKENCVTFPVLVKFGVMLVSKFVPLKLNCDVFSLSARFGLILGPESTPLKVNCAAVPEPILLGEFFFPKLKFMFDSPNLNVAKALFAELFVLSICPCSLLSGESCILSFAGTSIELLSGAFS